LDVGDAPVTPGLVAAHVSVGGEMNPDADAAHLRAMDGLTSDDARFRSCRDAGFLTAVAAPGSANVIGGTMEVVHFGDAEFPDTGVKFVRPAAARNNERYPISLAGQVELIDARLRSEPTDTNLYLPPAVRASLLAQRDRVLEQVKTRKLAACFEAQTRAEIQAALRLISEHKLRGVLLMPREVEDLTDEIRTARVAVIVAPLKPRDAERSINPLVDLVKSGVAFSPPAHPAPI